MKKLLLILTMAVTTLSFGATFDSSSIADRDVMYTQNSTFFREQMMTEENQERMLRAQPPVETVDSLERKNINKRIETWNDAFKTAYIYKFMEGVGCIGFDTIKGKVSSVNSQVTNPEQILTVDLYNHSDTPVVVSSPSLDGSYGTNGDAVFYFTSSGVYREFSGIYELSEQRIPMYEKAIRLQKMRDEIEFRKLTKELKNK